MFKDSKGFSSFSVNDLGKAKDFYGQTLGLNIKERPEGLSLDISGGGKVFIYPKENHSPATFTVLNFPVNDIDLAVDALLNKGMKMEQYDMGEMKTDEKGIVRNPSDVGPRAMAWFKDPAGNILGIMQEK